MKSQYHKSSTRKQTAGEHRDSDEQRALEEDWRRRDGGG